MIEKAMASILEKIRDQLAVRWIVLTRPNPLGWSECLATSLSRSPAQYAQRRLLRRHVADPNHPYFDIQGMRVQYFPPYTVKDRDYLLRGISQVIAESFIFSAFATVMVSYRADHPLIGVLRYQAWVLPFVGMFLAVCVYVAILAALSAVDTLKNQRDRMMAGLPGQLRIDLISAQSRMQWWGNLPTHIIPPVLFLIWAGALAFWHWSRHAGFWSGTGN